MTIITTIQRIIAASVVTSLGFLLAIAVPASASEISGTLSSGTAEPFAGSAVVGTMSGGVGGGSAITGTVTAGGVGGGGGTVTGSVLGVSATDDGGSSGVQQDAGSSGPAYRTFTVATAGATSGGVSLRASAGGTGDSGGSVLGAMTAEAAPVPLGVGVDSGGIAAPWNLIILFLVFLATLIVYLAFERRRRTEKSHIRR